MSRDIDPSDLIAQEAARAQTAEARQLSRQLEVEDFKWLMANKQGRRFLWRLLSLAGLFRSTFRLNNEMAFLEGMRNLGLVFWTDLHEICPEKYHLMVKEQEDNGKRANANRGN